VGVLTLADGRRLRYEVGGDPGSDDVVVLFHGAPGSRLFVPGPCGERLVVFDRPGYGESDPMPGRVVGDCAADVDALLDHLGVEAARLIAWSGGCPFAAATAHALGLARVRHLTLVGGPGPLDEVDGGWGALDDLRRPTAELARRDPARAARAVVRGMEPVIDRPESFVGTGRGADAEVLADPSYREMLEGQIREAMRQGATGIADDLVAMWLPWGFPLSAIDVPTVVFHGNQDPYNEADARTYSRRIPNAELIRWTTGGHMAILSNWSQVVAAGSRAGRPR
jgi:pimeloyl-ACP methyl ester carboxylesterase